MGLDWKCDGLKCESWGLETHSVRLDLALGTRESQYLFHGYHLEALYISAPKVIYSTPLSAPPPRVMCPLVDGICLRESARKTTRNVSAEAHEIVHKPTQL